MKQKIEYSKLISIITLLLFIFTLIIGFVFMFYTLYNNKTNVYDVVIFTTAITTTGGVWGVSVVSYYKKASLENNIKIQLGMIKEIAEMKHNYGDETDSYFDDMETMAINKVNESINNAMDDSLTPPEINSF